MWHECPPAVRSKLRDQRVRKHAHRIWSVDVIISIACTHGRRRHGVHAVHVPQLFGRPPGVQGVDLNSSAGLNIVSSYVQIQKCAVKTEKLCS